MDSHNPPKPGNLLNDLESIRQLLDQQQLEPPLLTESVDTSAIPLLCDIVPPSELVPPRPSLAAALQNRPDPAPSVASVAPVSAPVTPAPAAPTPTASAINASLQQRLHPGALELQRVDRELRAAAQLLLQDVIDDFVPQIEAELKRRLDVRLDLLLSQRKP
ncbi:MAG TPA: DNA polymerase III subunit chi [Pseudomonas sp.]|uniref:DNA polymerase III subunit chi n=1 Tax=Pseudomonas sp. TaxID=306 RepID=UPI002BAE94D1|nr:DNA polymerase III subunit chi [Pseudomonas sp.]HRL94168.1 DNA polymerase III subunit chi [Pseudomonas sp.]